MNEAREHEGLIVDSFFTVNGPSTVLCEEDGEEFPLFGGELFHAASIESRYGSAVVIGTIELDNHGADMPASIPLGRACLILDGFERFLNEELDVTIDSVRASQKQKRADTEEKVAPAPMEISDPEWGSW